MVEKFETQVQTQHISSGGIPNSKMASHWSKLIEAPEPFQNLGILQILQNLPYNQSLPDTRTIKNSSKPKFIQILNHSDTSETAEHQPFRT